MSLQNDLPPSPRFSTFAEIYDHVYAARGKEYAAEAALVMQIIRRHRPHAASLLDLACGTGEHLRQFAARFTVAGLDISREMLAVAARKIPAAALHEGDMLSADLPARFDAVTCLFSSIGYLDDVRSLALAARTIERHLSEDGIAVIETAVLPGNLAPPQPDTTDVHLPGGAIVTRHTTARMIGDRLHIDFRFTRSPSGEGFPFWESHVIRIFPAHAYIGALTRAGLTVIERTAFGRGTQLLVAIRHESCTIHPQC